LHEEDRLKMALIQGFLQRLQVVTQQKILQVPKDALQLLASFTYGKHENVKALQ